MESAAINAWNVSCCRITTKHPPEWVIPSELGLKVGSGCFWVELLATSLFQDGKKWNRSGNHWICQILFTVLRKQLHKHRNCKEIRCGSLCVCDRMLGPGSSPKTRLRLHPDAADGSGAAGEGGDASGFFPLAAGWLEAGDPGHVWWAAGQREGRRPVTFG